MSSSRLLTGMIGFFAAAQLALAATSPLTITRPSAGATVSGTITVEVAADAGLGITNMDVKLDGANIAAGLKAPPFLVSLDTRPLLSGVHTLLAIAQNNAGAVSRSEIISINTTNPPQYALAPGPHMVEELGPVLSANTQEKQIMFRHSQNGDLHLVLYYDTSDNPTSLIQLVDVNLTHGNTRLTNTVPGRPGPNATCFNTNNNKLYMGSGSPAHLVEYNPVSGIVRQIGPLRYRAAQHMEFGDDGWMYIGEYNNLGGGGVERYNPSTDALEDLGIMDTNQTAPQYAYTVGADQRYVYVGLGQIPWYLAVYDTQTGTKTIHWKGDTDTGGAVWHGRDGNWYYSRVLAGQTEYSWYRLTNGTPVSIPPKNPGVDMFAYNNESGNAIRGHPGFYQRWFNMEINLDSALPDSSTNVAIIKWRTIGAPLWQSAAVTGFRLLPINIKRLYPYSRNQLFGFADFYGPVFLYEVSTAKTTTLGRPRLSLYDGLFEEGKVYLSGYASASLRYSPSTPWTLTDTTPNMFDPAVNPCRISSTIGKYQFYLATGADGLVYIGSHHERDSTGGELGWYDPLTGTNGSLREPFLTNDVRDLKPALGGTKLVYSSNTERLFIFDVQTKQIERTVDPVPGVGSLDKVTEVAPGIILGAAGNRVFKVDIRNGSILYTNTLPGQAFGGSAVLAYDRRLCLGPDGFVWMFIDNSLYRINPIDCSASKILDTPAKTVLFKEGDLYLYGGSNLYRVRNILASTRPEAAGPLDITPVNPGP